MADYVPRTSDAAFKLPGSGNTVFWDPYPMYVLDTELASDLANITPGGALGDVNISNLITAPDSATRAALNGLYAPLSAASVSWSNITNKPNTFPPIIGTGSTQAKAGNYAPAWVEITGIPTFAAVATSGSYTDLSNTPNLAAVATSGKYSDLTGTIPSSALSGLAINNTFVVSSAAAMVALSSVPAARGDIAIRTDVSKSFVLSSTSSSSTADWIELVSSSSVVSVAGRTGTITLSTSDLSDMTAFSRLLAASASASAARATLGAGTSNLVVGTTATTAKAGNYAPSLADLPAGSTITVPKNGGLWPVRPTARTDLIVQWVGVDPPPPIVSSGTGGMLNNIDFRILPQ